MNPKHLLLLTLFAVITLNFGCTKILFEQAMPREAQRVYEFPPDFQGKYLRFNSGGGELSVGWTINYITQLSNSEVIIEEEQIVYLDSVENIKRGIGIIDSMIFEDGLLKVYAKNRVKTINVLDYEGQAPRDTMYHIDIKNEHYITGIRAGHLPDTAQCILQQKEKDYYLNINEYEGNWLVIKINTQTNALKFTHTSIHFDSDDYEKNQLEQDFGLRFAKQKYRGDKSLPMYISDMTDNQFYDLIHNSKSIIRFEWIKILPKKPNYLKWTLLLLAIGFTIYKFNSIKSFMVNKYKSPLNKNISAYISTKVLLVMLTLGAITGFENSQAFGDMIGFEMLTISNWVFFCISLVLFLMIKRTDRIGVKILLCVLELGIWIAKYFFYKGGYIAGFAGTPNIINVFYDSIALILRVVLLLSLLDKKAWFILPGVASVILIVLIKINCFALPWFTSYQRAKEDEFANKQRIEIIGNYKGEITKLESHEKLNIEIRIDSTKMYFLNESFDSLRNQYQYSIMYHNYGGLYSTNGNGFELEVKKMNEDSLVFHLSDMMHESFEVRLKRE